MATTTELVAKVKDLNTRLQGSAHDARILRWLNDERRFLLNEIGLAQADDLDFRSSLCHLDAGVSLVPLPADFQHLGGVQILGVDGLYHPSVRTDRDLFRQWDADSKSYGDSEYYHALRGLFVDIRPAPTVTTTDGLQYDYYYFRDDWEAGAEIESYWGPWVELLAHGAAMRSDFRNSAQRVAIEAHHDRRLMPQFKRRMEQRSVEPGRMLDMRHTSSMRAKRFGRFGRSF
jgi:hypothetical protein